MRVPWALPPAPLLLAWRLLAWLPLLPLLMLLAWLLLLPPRLLHHRLLLPPPLPPWLLPLLRALQMRAGARHDRTAGCGRRATPALWQAAQAVPQLRRLL
jgi:hypothetical protein